MSWHWLSQELPFVKQGAATRHIKMRLLNGQSNWVKLDDFAFCGCSLNPRLTVRLHNYATLAASTSRVLCWKKRRRERKLSDYWTIGCLVNKTREHTILIRKQSSRDRTFMASGMFSRTKALPMPQVNTTPSQATSELARNWKYRVVHTSRNFEPWEIRIALVTLERKKWIEST